MNIDKIDDILSKYGSIGKTGRVVFDYYAYKLVAKEIGLDWNNLTNNQKLFLKGDMILQYSKIGFVKCKYQYTK